MRHAPLRLVPALLAPVLLAVGCCNTCETCETDAPAAAAVAPLEESALGQTRNVHVAGNVLLAGQPEAADFEELAARGFERVVDMRQPAEHGDFDEAGLVQGLGMEYVNLGVRAPSDYTDALMDAGRRYLREADDAPVLLHCGSANRVGPVWIAYRTLDRGVPLEEAVAEAKRAGMRTPEYEQLARDYVAAHAR